MCRELSAHEPFSRSTRLHYVHNKILVEGYGSPLFNQDLAALISVADILCRLAPTNRVEPWDPNQKTLVSTNRLFTPVDQAYTEAIPMNKYVDANGELTALAALNGLIHVDDNNVDFFEQRGESA